MSDRTESLLTELVELQRRAIANQEQALAHQQQALEAQSQAVARQRATLKFIWVLIIVLLALIVVPLVFSWSRYLSYRG